MDIKIFPGKTAAAQGLARDLATMLESAQPNGAPFNIALSGGSTPRLLYEILAGPEFAGVIPWQRLHIYFGDERCVPLDDPASNHLMVKKAMLDHVPIPAANIHPINGGNDPHAEADRYAGEISRNLPNGANGLPRFGLVLLGLGGDGHTASLFPTVAAAAPGRDDRICLRSVQPESGQERVSLTMPVINAAKMVAFLVTGAAKAQVVAEVLKKKGAYRTYPAALVAPTAGRLRWYLDSDAARLLKQTP